MPRSEEIAEIKNKLEELERIQKRLITIIMLISVVIFILLMSLKSIIIELFVKKYKIDIISCLILKK